MTVKSVLLALCVGAVSLPVISACASLDVDPCSRQGIEYRMNRILKDYARDNRGEINDLKQAASYLEGQSSFGAMRLAFAVQSLRRMVDRFHEDVVPDVQEIALECNVADPLQDVFIDFLRDEGVKNEVLEWVEAFKFVFDA